MTTETEIWNMVTGNLRSRLPKNDIDTWLSRACLRKLEKKNNLAVIEVPNKFVANWIRDNYLGDIKKSFQSVLHDIPDIHFTYIKDKSSKSPYKLSKHKFNLFKNNLNKSMTFDNYVIGDCNRFAYSSAMEISNRPGMHYNPFFVFSESCRGKTHLLNAIGNHMLRNDPSVRVQYVHSKNLISDFHYSVKNNYFNNFIKKYHNLDVLLLDDIDQLANRNSLQVEFLSIFNKLYENKKQIVITGNRPPTRLKNFKPQLKSRLGWGLITDIANMDYQTKIQIVNIKTNYSNIHIPGDIISYLVKSNNDLKKLLKNIVRLETYISLNSGDINLSQVRSIIRNRDSGEIDIRDILSITSGYFNISVTDLVSDKKKKVYSYPRHMAMYLCRKHKELSFQEIGHQFGDRDHSTVLHAVKKIDQLKEKRKDVKEDLNNIENLLI